MRRNRRYESDRTQAHTPEWSMALSAAGMPAPFMAAAVRDCRAPTLETRRNLVGGQIRWVAACVLSLALLKCLAALDALVPTRTVAIANRQMFLQLIRTVTQVESSVARSKRCLTYLLLRWWRLPRSETVHAGVARKRFVFSRLNQRHLRFHVAIADKATTTPQ